MTKPIQTKRHKGFVLSVNDVVEDEEESIGFLLGHEERKEADEGGDGNHWYEEEDVSDTSSSLAVPQQREADEYEGGDYSTRGSTRDYMYNYERNMDGMGIQKNVTGNVDFRNLKSADSTLFDDYDLELMENNFKKYKTGHK